jgi:hypothetical protein
LPPPFVESRVTLRRAPAAAPPPGKARGRADRQTAQLYRNSFEAGIPLGGARRRARSPRPCAAAT